MELKISRIKLLNFILLLGLFQVTFIKFPYINNYNIIKYSIISCIGMIVLLNIKKNKNILDNKFKIMLLIYSVVIIYSGITNNDNHAITNTAIESIMYIVTFWELFTIIPLIKRNVGDSFIYKSFFIISTFYIIVTDLFIIFAKDLFMSRGEYYFIGNKFSVIYTHFNWLAFYLLNRTKYKSGLDIDFKIVLIMLLIVFISFKISCMTGIVGIISFIVLACLPLKIINNKNFGIIILIVSGLFPIIYKSVLNFASTRYFITNVLHRDLSLTGRIVIYENIPKIIDKHVLWGYGYGSSYEVWFNALHYPNSQNGLIDMIVETGIVSTAVFIIMIRKIFKENNRIIKLIICMYLILSTFEITLGNMMVAWLALLYSNKERNEVKE